MKNSYIDVKCPIFSRYCKEDSRIWFIADATDMLFELDVEKQQLIYLGKIPNAVEDDLLTVGAIVKVDNLLVMAPWGGDNFIVFDLEEGLFTSIEYTLEVRDKFSHGFVYCDTLFFVGSYLPIIVVIDKKSKKLQYIEYPRRENEYKAGLFSRGTTEISGNFAYIPNCYNSDILKLNLVTYDVELNSVCKNNFGFNEIIGIEKDLFLLTPREDASLLTLNGVNGSISSVYNSCGFVGEKAQRSIRIQNKVFIINSIDLSCFLIDLDKNIVKAYKLNFDLQKYTKDKYETGEVQSIFSYKNQIYIISNSKNIIYWFNIEDGKLHHAKICMEKGNYIEFTAELKSRKFISEGYASSYVLSDYLKVEFEGDKTHNIYNCGDLIYQEICKDDY